MSVLAVVAIISIPVALVLAKYWVRSRELVRHDAPDWERLLSAPRFRAKILQAEQDGMTNLKPNFRLVLRIDLPEGAYPVETDQYVGLS